LSFSLNLHHLTRSLCDSARKCLSHEAGTQRSARAGVESSAMLMCRDWSPRACWAFAGMTAGGAGRIRWDDGRWGAFAGMTAGCGCIHPQRLSGRMPSALVIVKTSWSNGPALRCCTVGLNFRPAMGNREQVRTGSLSR
jgi:hypothetical protein